MLCGIRCSDERKVFARESTKEESPFVCPRCKNELVIRKGNIKIHHFAHKPPFNCSHGEGETEAHRRCKESIYNNLKSKTNVTHVDVEADLGSLVADIYAVINGAPVAIEVQKSNISVNEITRRTTEYHKAGISVLWLALFNDRLNNERYSPGAWEKWCHAVYFGRVYYWLGESTVLPVHFSEYHLYVEESTWFESGGYEQSAGGYYKTSKRYKTPVPGNEVDIATHFSPSTKNEWQGGTVYIPSCRIYLDKQRAWWK
ncbi:competence protein CoiA [Trichloromonas sp.]|uniref:competence protein CoiA n=1 Tax=Trichloromonas sp. TaxID=3069249 RepID=UPI002A37F5CE|nr:competence protein CoiA family protein [Trichloromonas sp.]